MKEYFEKSIVIIRSNIVLFLVYILLFPPFRFVLPRNAVIVLILYLSSLVLLTLIYYVLNYRKYQIVWN